MMENREKEQVKEQIKEQKLERELEQDYFEEYQFEIENRIRNLCWTVSGDYSLNLKLDTVSFSKSPYISLYDAVKQGGFSRYFDRDAFGLYLVKKLYCGADEQPLTVLAQMAVDSAVYRKVSRERPGVLEIRKKAFSDTLEFDFNRLAAMYIGQIRIAVMQEAIRGGMPVQSRMQKALDMLKSLEETDDVMDIIRVVDELYNWLVDPYFERNHGDLDKVLSVTMEELKEFSWKEFLEEEAAEEELTQVLNRVEQAVTQTAEVQTDQEKKERRMKRVVVDAESAAKMYSYIELNYGRSYLTPGEQERLNRSLCRGAHADCSLYFTDGILSGMVKRNYQSEYARRAKSDNLRVYGHNMRVSRRNIEQLSDTLRRALTVRSERETVRSEYGTIAPARLWKLGRSRDKKLFDREVKKDSSEFVVFVLIDASGSQRVRQEKVALQAYILMEALSQVQIPQRVMSFCTFWDHTILQRFREYDEDRSANERIFSFTTSSNNRDGLAIRAAAQGLLARQEERKILIILSDGRPYDVILNRPNARNPQPYYGDYAVTDTGTEVRRLRNLGVSVLGVFAGEEKDLEAEKKIFGKDFAYIRDISNFSRIVGNYLMKQIEENC